MIPVVADAGVPMLFLEVPAMLCALVPVIIVEVLVARRMLKLNLATNIKAVTVANIASTLIGFPLLWLLLLGIEIIAGTDVISDLTSFPRRIFVVIVQSPWLPPYENDFNWLIPAAAIYLLIPAFFVSVFLERWICEKFWPEQEKEAIRKFSWNAHFASYAVLLFVAAIYYYVIFVI